MRRLIAAEVEYLRKKLYWALAISGGPIAILTGIVNPLIFGRIAVDSSAEFLIVFIFSWSMMFSLILLIGGQGIRLRTETRQRLHMALPLTKSEIGLANLTVKVASIGLLYVPWFIIVPVAGYWFEDHELTGLLLMNGLILIMFLGLPLIDQIIDLSRPRSNVQKTAAVILIIAFLTPTVSTQPLINLLQKFQIDATGLSVFQAGFKTLITSRQGAIGLNILGLSLPILTYVAFMFRRSFVSRRG